MRKVLIFKETLLPSSETFILEQIRGFVDYEPVLAGLERVRPGLPLPHEPLILCDHGPALSSFRAKVYRRTGVAPLFHSKAKRSHPLLVHAHFASGGRTALPLARSLGVPLIVTLHGSDVTVRNSNADTYQRLGESATLFVCVSEFIRERAIEAGFPPQKLIVHHIGVDRELFSSAGLPGPKQSVLFVGRLVEKKGCEYLLHAMQRVQRAHPQCELNVIGDGPLRPSLEALARELNIRCFFHGVQPATGVRQALRKASIFCVPSVTAENGDSEGLPTVLAEALATGVPAVSTVHGGIPEIVVDGVTGLLAPERDHVALADALCRLLGDGDLWHDFHRAALKRIESQFDLKRQTALLEEIYSGVLTDFYTGRRTPRTGLKAADGNPAGAVCPF
jgi:colanic acid/amylovoran biosynthesis glycosyltransferase